MAKGPETVWSKQLKWNKWRWRALPSDQTSQETLQRKFRPEPVMRSVSLVDRVLAAHLPAHCFQMSKCEQTALFPLSILPLLLAMPFRPKGGHMLCQRCRGLLVRETFIELRQEASSMYPATRCLNCGYIEDTIVRTNRLRPPASKRPMPRGMVRKTSALFIHTRSEEQRPF